MILTLGSTPKVLFGRYVHHFCNQNRWNWAKIASFYYMYLLVRKFDVFLSIFNDFDYRYGARSDQIVPLGYFTMSKSCLEGLTYLVTIVVCTHRPWFQSISTHFEVSVVLIMKLFPHTLWGIQIPWFWALFEPPKIAHTQLQAPAENFLEVVWS